MPIQSYHYLIIIFVSNTVFIFNTLFFGHLILVPFLSIPEYVQTPIKRSTADSVVSKNTQLYDTLIDCNTIGQERVNNARWSILNVLCIQITEYILYTYSKIPQYRVSRESEMTRYWGGGWYSGLGWPVLFFITIFELKRGKEWWHGIRGGHGIRGQVLGFYCMSIINIYTIFIYTSIFVT